MTENRLNDLEIKFTLQEDLLEELNSIVTSQQLTIDSLVKEVKRLKEGFESVSIGEGSIDMQEKPPHY